MGSSTTGAARTDDSTAEREGVRARVCRGWGGGGGVGCGWSGVNEVGSGRCGAKGEEGEWTNKEVRCRCNNEERKEGNSFRVSPPEQ